MNRNIAIILCGATSIVALFSSTVVYSQESPRDIKTASISPSQSMPITKLTTTAESESEQPVNQIPVQKKPAHKKQTAPQQRYVPSSTDTFEIQNVSTQDVPYNAKAGECYAKVLKNPGEYKKVFEKTVVKEAYKKTDIIPAKFQWVDEKIVIEEPAETLVKVPAEYKVVQEKILIEPAKTVWKKGSSYQGLKVLSQKTTDAGQVMCLVEEPAKYKVIEKRTLVSPEQIKRVKIEAKYTTIKVKKLVEPAKEVVTEVPAEYKDVEKEVAVQEPVYAWSRVVCNTNLNKKNVENIQLALQKKNAYQGPINGQMDEKLLSAANKYASDHGLAHGSKFIAMEVIDALNIKF